MKNEIRQNVLVIEEEESISRLLARMLEDTCDVYTAKSTRDAIPQLLDRRPSAIVIDFDLDRDGGLDDLKVVRAIGATIPIVMLSNAEHQGEIEKGQKLGVDAILSKPFAVVDARTAVKNCIRLASQYALN